MISQGYALTVSDTDARWWYVIGWDIRPARGQAAGLVLPIVVPMGSTDVRHPVPGMLPDLPRVLEDPARWDADPAGLTVDDQP